MKWNLCQTYYVKTSTSQEFYNEDFYTSLYAREHAEYIHKYELGILHGCHLDFNIKYCCILRISTANFGDVIFF